MAKSTIETLSPLVRVLQKQILPLVNESGMDNIIIAAPSWNKFQQVDDPLPRGAYVTRETLKSKRIPVKTKMRDGKMSLVNAVWPEDGLCSRVVPFLMFVAEGEVVLPLGDYVVHCQPGHAILIPAGTPHAAGSILCTEQSQKGNIFNSMFSMIPRGNGVECWLNHTRDGQHWSHRDLGENCHVLSAQANFYLETLAEEAAARSPHFRSLCHGLLLSLVTLLTREMEAQRAFQPVLVTQNFLDADTASQQDLHPIARAQSYIHNHLQESLSIDHVASHVFMSRAYFTRKFREVTGKTFLQYVTEYRLTEAKVLLLDTNWTIEKISDFVGVTPPRLRSLFFQFEHQTPSDFRRVKRQRRNRADTYY